MIAKIIVELADAEASFKEFSSIAEFVESDLFKTETATVVEATPAEEPAEESEADESDESTDPA